MKYSHVIPVVIAFCVLGAVWACISCLYDTNKSTRHYFIQKANQIDPSSGDQLSISYGDVNNDGVINMADATEAIACSFLNNDFSDAQIANADVNGDGEINAEDASLILKRSAGMIELFPIETIAMNGKREGN